MKKSLALSAAFLVPMLFLIIMTQKADGQSWPATQAEWDALDVQELSEASIIMRRAGESAKSDLHAMGVYVTERVMGSAETIRSSPFVAIYNFIWTVRYELDAQSKAAWAVNIRAAYVTADRGLGEMEPLEALQVVDMMTALGRPEDRALLARYVIEGTTWKEISIPLAGRYLWHLHFLGDNGKAARTAIAEEITADIARDPYSVTELGAKQWKDLVFNCLQELNDEQRASWRCALKQAMLPSSGAAVAMSAKEVESFWRTLQWLGEPDAEKVVRECLGDFGDLDTDDAEVLRRFQLGLNLEGRSAQQARKDLANKIIERYSDLSSSRDLSGEECIVYARAYRSLLNREQARQWAEKAYEACVSLAPTTKNLRLLTRLGWLMWDCRMLGRDKQFPEVTAAVLAHIQNGNLDNSCEQVVEADWLAGMMQDANAKELLISNLAASSNGPRMGVAEILAWVHRYDDEMDAWSSILDSYLDREDCTGDRRARWLLARGYAVNVQAAEYSPLCGQQDFEEALASAESSELQLEIIQRILAGYCKIGCHDRGLKYLDELRAASCQEWTTAIEEFDQWICENKIKYQEAQARRMQQQLTDIADSHREEIEKRLQAAREKGDLEGVQRYEKLLGM